jgi:hypothetical protein
MMQAANFSEQLLLDLVDGAERRDQEYQRAINEVQDVKSLVTKTPWLRYVKWEEIFLGRDMKELHTLTDLPKAEDDDGIIIINGVNKLLRECWDGYHDCLERGWQLLPFWLASVQRDKEDTKPFRSYIAPYTFTRYIGYWQSYIMFCIRMYEQTEETVQFTLEQRELLDSIQLLLSRWENGDKEELYDLVSRLSVALICHSDYARERSSLIYYSGVRGYNTEYKQWRQPQDYTTILAGLQFCIRIIMLERALPRTERDTFDEHSVMNPVEQFCLVRNKWLIDGESTCIIYGANYRYSIWIYTQDVELWYRRQQKCHYTEQNQMVC